MGLCGMMLGMASSGAREGGCRRQGLTGAGTRRLDDINKNCLEEFRKHWECLEQNNQQLWQCRRPETKLNGCVFDKLVSPSHPNKRSKNADEHYHYRNWKRQSLELQRKKHQSICGNDRSILKIGRKGGVGVLHCCIYHASKRCITETEDERQLF